MAQTTNDMLYLSCTGCNLKFHNDDEHIKQDFGYDRLGKHTKVVLNVVSDMLSIVKHIGKKGENMLSNITKEIKIIFQIKANYTNNNTKRNNKRKANQLLNVMLVVQWFVSGD